ncbi:MAG TPA: adenylate/guanylate cyclase domain-containing protein [Nitrososphaeraceae archaeon]|nr:adenylate/guanylate cyclase domain-containing protein [Nitrososphaeraceae archaeon]
MNLYKSGIPVEVIAFQTDLDVQEVQNIVSREEQKNSGEKNYSAPSLSEFYLNAIVDIDELIKNAQARTWSALQAKEFHISTEDSRQILENLLESKTRLVIIHVDLVGFTKLCMSLPANRLADIIRAFTQEVSILITSYGGYILKFVGDAVLGFFLVKSSEKNDDKLPCINAVNCALSMVSVIRHGINPILSQYDYPEIHVRIGVDVGENVVVQYGWETSVLKHGTENILTKKPIIDIIGYTISIAVKMTALAESDQIVMGQMVYDSVDQNLKERFKEFPIHTEVWNYISSTTGGIYRLYGSIRDYTYH